MRIIRQTSFLSSHGNFGDPDIEMFVGSTFKSSTAKKTSDKQNIAVTSSEPIQKPNKNDVLMGRGGKNNQHSGNEKLRELARQRCERYRNATKSQKSNLSWELVRLMKALEPPARFLRKDPMTNMWLDVGDDRAREKASQVLRDAVSEKNGPMARSSKKRPETPKSLSDASRSHTPAPTVPDSQPSSMKEDMTSFSNSQSSIPSRELRSDMMSMSLNPYDHSFYTSASGTNLQATTPETTNQYPSVTPGTGTAARKRQRAQEVPLPAFNYFASFSYPPTPGNSMLANTPPAAIMSSPLAAQYLRWRPSPAFDPQSASHFSTLQRSSVATYEQSAHNYANQGGIRAEPWVADIHATHSSTHPSLPHGNDFDLYNDELLSDHSDHRDGSISPFAYTHPR